MDGRRKGRLGGHLGDQRMGGMAGVGGHLHGQLPTGRQPTGEPGQLSFVVGHPLQRRVGGDDVDRRLRLEGSEVGQLEPHAVDHGRGAEHRRRGVDADGGGHAETSVQVHGELPRPATQIDGPATGDRLEQRHQVVEGLTTLPCEAPVLLRVPGVVVGHAALVADQPAGLPTGAAAGGVVLGS